MSHLGSNGVRRRGSAEEKKIGRLVGTMLMLVFALTGACFVGAAGASAAASPIVFGEPGSGNGQFIGVTAVAVDNSLTDPSAGDIYIADSNNNRVDKFGPSGEFLLAWGWGVADGSQKLETCGPATAAPECHEGIAGAGAGQLSFPVGIAVDISLVSGSTGDVYVEDSRNNRIEKFGPDGEFLLAWGEGVANGEAKAETCGPDASPPTSTCQTGSEGSGHGEFNRLEHSIAVDSEGTVYVGLGGVENTGPGQVQEFSGAGVFKLQVTIEENLLKNVGGPVEDVAVDESHHMYIMVGGRPGVHEFESCTVSCIGVETPTPVREPPEVAAFNAGIAIGPSGELFVASANQLRVTEWNPAGQEVADFPSPGLQGYAAAFADGAGHLVVAGSEAELLSTPADVPQAPRIESEMGTGQPAATATVQASIDPEGSQTEYRLVYGPEGGPVTETTPQPLIVAATGEAAKGFEPETVKVELTGLKPSVTYHFHFVVENVVGATIGADERFTALPGVVVEGESVSQVTGTSARLGGVVNPLGTVTGYRFEYLSQAEFEADSRTFTGPDRPVSLPSPEEGDAGAGVTGVPVNVLAEGLSPDTTYHYRVIAHNALGEAAGLDATFTTQSVASSALVDGRAWEMVSPPEKHGSALEMPTSEAGVIQASEDGSRVSYFAYAPVSSSPPASRSYAYQQFLSEREKPGVWNTQDITTREETIEGLEPPTLAEYKLFSADLSTGLVEPQGATPLCTHASQGECPERTQYLRDNASGEYLPLLPAVGMRSGVKFGGHPVGEVPGNLYTGGVGFVTATPDFSHIILTSEIPLTPDFPEGFKDGAGGTESDQYKKNLYEWSGGKIQLANIMPDGHPGTVDGLDSSIGASSNNNEYVRHAVSADGSRIVFTTDIGGTYRHLFVRDIALGRTVQLDVPEEGIIGQSGDDPEYVDASTDGSRVFFTDTQRLTPASAAREGVPDLYVCEVSAVLEAGEPDCTKHLEDLSSSVQGVDLGVDSTGRYVYYVAGGTAAPALYMSDVVSGERRLIAELDPGDAPDWEADTDHHNLKELTARVSNNGRFVAFMSDRSLTGYDNTDAYSGQPDEEVFLYDRVANTLRCVSCNPTGARPVGVLDPPTNRELPLLVDRPRVWQGRWIAGSLPGWPAVNVASALYEPRNLDDSGRVFFDSSDALVPGDTNGKEDVYEFEPDGVGSCRLESGCIGLISSGTSSEESAFIDASATGPGGEEGKDVFFMTSAKLAPQDTDGALDVYDAHMCSTVEPCASGAVVLPPACSTADSCRAAPLPQPDVYGAPASATLTAPVNLPPSASLVGVTVKARALTRVQKLAGALRACRKDRSKRRRRSCEQAAHRRYGTASARKSASGRRTGR